MDEQQPATTRDPAAAARAAPVRLDPTLAIYGAVLGRPPTIDPDLAHRDRGVEVRLHVGVNVRLGGTARSPYRPATLTDRLGQWAADAIRDLDVARRRMIGMRTRRWARSRLADAATDAGPGAILTVGTSARRRTPAEPSERSAA